MMNFDQSHTASMQLPPTDADCARITRMLGVPWLDSGSRLLSRTELTKYGWASSVRAAKVHEGWYPIKFRCNQFQLAYLYDGNKPYKRKPIPVSLELQLGLEDRASAPSRPSITTLKVCVNYIDKLKRGKWIDKGTPAQVEDVTALTPQLLTRADATDRQKAAIVDLFSLNVVSTQLMREIAFDRLVNIFLTGILSAHAKHCIFLSHRDDNQSSEATNLPLSVIISDSAPTKLLECLAAPTRMSQMLYRTLIFFIMHHYRSLSDVDASVMMDARLSAYSIFHCQTEFTIFSNVPRLDKAPDGRYQWSFETKESMSYRWTMPLKHVSRIVMLDAMLALEQHLYELKGFLKFT